MNNEEFNAKEIIIEDNLLSQNLNSEQLITSYTSCDFNISDDTSNNTQFSNQRQSNNNQLDLSRIFESISVGGNENRNTSNNSSQNNSVTTQDININNHSNDYLYQYDLEMFLYSLPEINIDNSYLKYIDQKKKDLDNITKCMICYCDFEINETIKTLPCSK